MLCAHNIHFRQITPYSMKKCPWHDMKIENLNFSLDKEKSVRELQELSICSEQLRALINFSSGEEMWSVAFQIHATSLLQTTLAQPRQS